MKAKFIYEYLDLIMNESSVFKPKTLDEIKGELEEKYLNRVFKNVYQDIFHVFDIVYKGSEEGFILRAHPLFKGHYGWIDKGEEERGLTPVGFDNWAKPVDKEQLAKRTRSKFKKDIILNSR